MRNEPRTDVVDLTLDDPHATPVQEKAKARNHPSVPPKFQSLYSDSSDSEDSDGDVFVDAFDDSILTL